MNIDHLSTFTTKSKIFTFTLVLILLYANALKSQTHNDWSYNLNIYEVSLRNYTPSGTIAEFKSHLGRIKELGAGIIWFMPVHPIGVQNRLGSLGSPYSVKDYFAVNPRLGTMEEFKALVDTIHTMGMYVLIDWVGNHTSWDNDLTLTNPEYYVKDINGNFIPPPGTNWSDVIQLNYNNPDLRNYMINAMSFWIEEAGVDGFRCDAASFIPSSFWIEAISALKNIKPDLFMLAEDDSPNYQYMGFDMSYSWGLHAWGNGIFDRIVSGSNNANHLSNYIYSEMSTFQDSHYRMYFTSNHDENAWYGTVFEQFGAAAEPFAVLSAALNGMNLIYNGQEAGLNKRLAFFDKDLIPWQPHPFEEMYRKLSNLKRRNAALWNGENSGEFRKVINNNAQKILSFIRENGDDKIFAVFNLSPVNNSATLNDTNFYGTYVEVFSGDTISFNQNYTIDYAGWDYRLYERINSITSIAEIERIPDNFKLEQNYPNPFNPSTTIKYNIPLLGLVRPGVGDERGGLVTLKVFDILGKEVTILVNETKHPGTYEVDFNAGDLPSGVYFYSLKAGNFHSVKKMVILK